MANDTQITLVGNLTADPELRYTQSGTAVASFTVASTPRSFDKQTGQWKDGDTLFLRCSIWRDYAENVAESLGKGMQVIVQGRLVQRQYTPRDGGEQRTVYELQVEDVGPTLRFARAQVQRQQRGYTNTPQQAAPVGQQGDSWGAPAPTGGTWDQSEAPF